MINIPYRASTYVGRRNRKRFMRAAAELAPVTPSSEVPVTVYGFSGEGDWPEQAACIRSFLRYVGRPKRFVIVSDGTHTETTRRLLEKLHACVSVVSLSSILKPDLPAQVHRYASQHVLGKKLALFLSLPVDGPTIYCDSDILFFPGAVELANLLRLMENSAMYLLDCWASLDERLIENAQEKELPVNSGFVIMGCPLDWSGPLARLQRMVGDCKFFTEQTIVHLAVKANGGQPLPPATFVLRNEDQFEFVDRFANRNVAIRHYISSIRTKLWHHLEHFS